MEKRSHAGQMDFEWQNKSGPIDQSSPWAQLRQPSPQRHNQPTQKTDNITKKRPYSIFDSPGKAATFPALRDPAASSHSFLFSTQSPAFATPREPDYASSEAELNSSPDNNNADSEATPDTGPYSQFAKSNKSFTHILDQGREGRNANVGRASGASGRGEISRGIYSNAIEKRHWKNRRRDGERRTAVRRRQVESDSEDGAKKTSSGERQLQHNQKPGLFPSVLGFIDTHPNLPHVLSFYAQLTLNIFLVFSFMYIIYSFWATIKSDVDKKSEEAIAVILGEIEKCRHDFYDNRCDRDTRAPALETLCNNWQLCMNRDPKTLGRAKVSAHTFAEIFNSFIEPISYKAMIFSLVVVFGCLSVSNLAFSRFREKAHPPAPPPTPFYGMASPQRNPSGSAVPQNFYWNHEAQSPTTMLMGRETQLALTAEGDVQSPTRRLQFH